MRRACGDDRCSTSFGICGSLTFGRGHLDPNGYWEIPCAICARAFDGEHPNVPCWPDPTYVPPPGVDSVVGIQARHQAWTRSGITRDQEALDTAALELYEDVLKVIATGAPEARHLAEVALSESRVARGVGWRGL